jgi:hypothetical protein
MLRGRSFTLLILLAVLAATSAYSTTITWYTDPVSWQAVVSGLTTIDFNSTETTQGEYFQSSTNPGFTFGNAEFTDMWNSGAQGTLIGYGPADGFPFNFGTQAYLQGMQNYFGNSSTYLRVKLNSGQTAASALFATGNNGGAGTNIKVVLSSGDQYVLPTSSSAWTFLGFVSDTAITEIDITSVALSAYPFIDNFTYGSKAPDPGPGPDPGPDPTDTPDLGTLFLCGAGFTLLSLASRFRKLFHH